MHKAGIVAFLCFTFLSVYPAVADVNFKAEAKPALMACIKQVLGQDRAVQSLTARGYNLKRNGRQAYLGNDKILNAEANRIMVHHSRTKRICSIFLVRRHSRDQSLQFYESYVKELAMLGYKPIGEGYYFGRRWAAFSNGAHSIQLAGSYAWKSKAMTSFDIRNAATVNAKPKIIKGRMQ